MRKVTLCIISVLALAYLGAYGTALIRNLRMHGDILDFTWASDLSIWLYKKRTIDGQFHGTYSISAFSIMDPEDGPNAEIKILGWIPAICSLSALVLATTAMTRKKNRAEPAATDNAVYAPH